MIRDKLSLAEVTSLIAAENARRLEHATLDAHERESEAAQRLDSIFGTNSTLAVYGTLAPGRQNYHIVRPLGGDWTDGLIEGDLQETGWGATLGYPAFRPRTGGSILQIRVLQSEKLPEGWKMVDEFEGPEYHRILIPVFFVEEQGADGSRRLYTVANIYAARDSNST